MKIIITDDIYYKIEEKYIESMYRLLRNYKNDDGEVIVNAKLQKEINQFISNFIKQENIKTSDELLDKIIYHLEDLALQLDFKKYNFIKACEK